MYTAVITPATLLCMELGSMMTQRHLEAAFPPSGNCLYEHCVKLCLMLVAVRVCYVKVCSLLRIALTISVASWHKHNEELGREVKSEP